ncbi:hypothetical protein SKAU_G00027950 [Synaphobranchus kaupii]|uniref:Adiponectin receptor 2 n=1 Tax=Synaphobranchus kaupii TaxID=118154 RepID=A0A9Q1JF74_SYNKA|nr:hypothetical protein SKAU_G00027950 [Synaphobranchus kaupii]
MSPREQEASPAGGCQAQPECPKQNGEIPDLKEQRGSEMEEQQEEEEEKSSDEGFMGMTPLLQAHHAIERVEEFVQKMWEGRWRVIPHDVLPDWLKDNDFLLHGHRPPMPSFRACFKSIFRIHTETGNIWTHLLGCLFFLCLGIFYMFRPNMSFVAPVQEKVVIGMFFLGAILCLSFSWLFHTVYCHSEGVSRVFSKLDYSGIAFLIMGSFVPWLYYSFYCSPQPCFIYLIVVCILGISAIVVSQCDFFATPQYRGVRAGVFVGLGLSGLVPTLHFTISEGFLRATTMGRWAGSSSWPHSTSPEPACTPPASQRDSSLESVTFGSTLISCSTSWLWREPSFTSMESPTCRSSATRLVQAAPKRAPCERTPLWY